MSKMGTDGRRRLPGFLGVLAAAVALSASVSGVGAGAAPGDPDPSFGTGGKVTTDFNGGDDQARALAVDREGRLVMAGFSPGRASSDFALARYQPDGMLDRSFGAGGRVTTDIAGQLDEARAVALLADGRIVVGGVAYAASEGGPPTGADFALARYLPDGTLDGSFGKGGTVVTDLGLADDAVAGLTVGPGGTVVAVGCTRCQKVASDFALARYRPDGSLDAGFGTGGIVVTDFFDGTDGASAVLPAPAGDGSVLVAGFAAGERRTETNNRQTDFALARYGPDGRLDTSFGRDGKALVDFTGINDDAAAVAFDADGRILTAGFASVGDGFDFALARFDPSGGIDLTFGTGGKVTTDFGGPNDQGAALAIAPDGGIVVAGLTQVGTTTDFALARYSANGMLDRFFGSAGLVVTDFAGGDDGATGLSLRPDGAIVPIGYAAHDGLADFALAAYGSQLLAAGVSN